MNIEKYFKRIRVNQVEAPSFDFLKRLMLQHLISIPFENLDIACQVEIRLDEKHLFNKVVLDGRGGFCYELNGLFAFLLKALGFSVTLASARVFSSDKQEYGPEFDHLILLVDLDRRYLVDMGFGESSRKPMPLRNVLNESIREEYRVIRYGNSQNSYSVQKYEHNIWLPQYRFTEIPRKLSDFHDMCVYHQTSPDSHFTKKAICTIATKNGRKTLTDTELIITRGREKTNIPVTSEKDFKRLLQEHFRIKL